MPPRPGLTPERIVEAAAELIDRDGYDRLALGKVAAELGVRTPSLYNHIDGLDELRRLLTIRALTVLGAELQRAAVGIGAEDAVRGIALAYRRFAHEHPGLYATTVPSIEEADAEVQRVGAEVMRTVLTALAGFGLDDAAAIHATRSVRSAVHGFVSLELGGGFGIPVDIDASFAWLTDLLAEGIRARAEGG
jgi:AcrR family transcriptional regulator